MSNNIFLFFGEEGFLIQERINELKKEISDPSLNIETIDADSVPVEDVISALQTQPLLIGQKLIIIKNLDFRSEVASNLVPCLKLVPASTRVVFTSITVDKRSKLFKTIDKMGEVYEFKQFADWEQNQVVLWIVRRAASLGKQIDQSTARQLQEICGSSLQKLASEIDKLVTYVGEQKAIKQDDVLALASPGEINTFALARAVAEKNLKQALTAFRIIYKNRQDLFSILSLLATQYKTMLQTKCFPKVGSSSQTIAQNLGANPYFVRKCMEKAANFSHAELRRALALLLETNMKLKSGEQQLTTFELMLTSLCLPGEV